MISSASMVKQVKKGQTSSVLPLIARFARKAHKQLPYAEQTVYSVQDLIAEGKNYLVTHVVKRYKADRQTKFITLAYTALEHYYIDRVRAAHAEKRYKAIFSLDSTVTQRGIKLMTIVRAYNRYERLENDIVNRIDAERAFIKAYALASPLLRRYMIRWLLQPIADGRCKPGTNFNLAREGFQKLIVPSLSLELCDFIQADYLCRTSIADQLVKRFNTPIHKTKNGFAYSEEAVLFPGTISRQGMMEIAIG